MSPPPACRCNKNKSLSISTNQVTLCRLCLCSTLASSTLTLTYSYCFWLVTCAPPQSSSCPASVYTYYFYTYNLSPFCFCSRFHFQHIFPLYLYAVAVAVAAAAAALRERGELLSLIFHFVYSGKGAKRFMEDSWLTKVRLVRHQDSWFPFSSFFEFPLPIPRSLLRPECLAVLVLNVWNYDTIPQQLFFEEKCRQTSVNLQLHLSPPSI